MGALGGHRQHLAAKVVDIGDAAVNAGLLLYLGGSLVRLFRGEDAKVFVIFKIGAVKAVQARHLGAGDLIKHAPLAENPAHAGGQGGVEHLGLAAQHNGHLHLVHVVHTDPGGVVGAGEPGQEFGHAGELYALFGDDVPLAQRDNLFADIHHVPLFKIGLDILGHQVREVFPNFDLMGVDGAAVILPPIHLHKQGFFRVCFRDLFDGAHG